MICLKCLEKPPERRYQSAEELADDCRRFLANEPIAARPASILYRARKRLAKHKGLAVASVVALVLALGLGGYLAYDWWRQVGRWEVVYHQDFTRPDADVGAFIVGAEHDLFTETAPPEIDARGVHLGRLTWLRDVHLRGDVKVEAKLRWPERVDGFEIHLHARREPAPPGKQYGEMPPGHGCQFGGFGGTGNFISTNATWQLPNRTDEVAARFEAGRVYDLAYEYEDGELRLLVDDELVRRQTELLPLPGEGLEWVAFRSWSAVDVLSVTVRRLTLPEKASPLVSGDSLLARGHEKDAIEQYRAVAKDFAGTVIAEKALAKAYLAACRRPGETVETRDAVRREMAEHYAESPLRARLLEADCLALWRQKRHAESSALLPEVFKLDPETRVVLHLLACEREPLSDETGQDLLRWVARTRNVDRLDLKGLGLMGIEPLAAMRLVRLSIHGNRVSSLGPLSDMRLRYLDCTNNAVSSLDPLRGQPLVRLFCGGNDVESLEPLGDMALERLDCQENRITDLEPLRGMPLAHLGCSGNRIDSLGPLRGMRLERLNFSANPIGSLEPLRGMPLQHLDCQGSRISDIAPLEGMPLQGLHCTGSRVSDITPLRGMPLRVLRLDRCPIGKADVLRGMPLEELGLQGCAVIDLDILRESRLRSLSCAGCGLDSLEALGGQPLADLSVPHNRITDLTPLKGMPLVNLDCRGNLVASLVPLAGMKLKWFCCQDTRIKSLEPFVREPPEVFWFESASLPDAELERAREYWTGDPRFAEHARNAAIYLALRKRDVERLKALATEHKGHRYLRVCLCLAWQRAKKFCEELGGHLATISSRGEAEVAAALHAADKGFSWIGLSTSAEEVLEWVTREPVSHRPKVVLYSRRPDRRACATADAEVWVMTEGDEEWPFIIEWDD